MNNRGLIVLSMLFVALLAFIGLSLLSSTLFHLNISQAKIKRDREQNLLKNEMVRYIHHFREKLYEIDLEKFELPEGYFNKARFKDHISNGFKIKSMFKCHSRESAQYSTHHVCKSILINRKKEAMTIQSEVWIEILTGCLPVSMIPLYVSNEKIISKERFLSEKKIQVTQSGFKTGSELKPDLDLSAFVKDSLELKCEFLNWREIREKLGLDPIEKPVPNGIYSVLSLPDKDIAEAFFIQGDVDKLELSSSDHVQYIRIHKEGQVFIIQYGTEDVWLRYGYGSDIEEMPSQFRERIIINGNLLSITAPEPNSREISPLGHSDLTIYASGKIVVDSSIQTAAGHTIKLIADSNSFLGKYQESGKIFINDDPDADSVTTHITVIATESLVNQAKNLNFHGSVYANDIVNNGHIQLHDRSSRAAIDPFIRTKPTFYIKDFIASYNGAYLDD